MEAAKYIWLGTNKILKAFTFFFRENEHGVFTAHCYPFSKDLGTVIVECDEASWRRAGLDQATEAQSLAYCEKLFADVLDGHSLLSNRAAWINFLTVKNKAWHYRNIVLLGDSVHTAHFSVGSGTKMAMEDGIALARSFRRHTDLEAALTDYEIERRPYVEGIQRAAQERAATYFENTRRYFHLEPLQFAFRHLLTRSGANHLRQHAASRCGICRSNRPLVCRPGLRRERYERAAGRDCTAFFDTLSHARSHPGEPAGPLARAA